MQRSHIEMVLHCSSPSMILSAGRLYSPPRGNGDEDGILESEMRPTAVGIWLKAEKLQKSCLGLYGHTIRTDENSIG